MNMKQLRYVLVLANEGTFSRAAQSLNISQPSLSQYIKKIEESVGAELFDRAGGYVRLTDAGKVYVDIGKKILDLEHTMELRFSDINEMKSGSLVIGAAPFRSVGMMPTIASRFSSLYPGMYLEIIEKTTAELLEGTEHGEFDLCLMTLPVDNRIFEYKKITEEELVLAVPASFEQLGCFACNGRRHKAVNVNIINGKRFVMVTDAQVMQKSLENICLDYNLTLEKAAVVKNLDSQIAMVREGIGYALVPSSIESIVNDGSVRFYSFAEELPRREVVVMWRRDMVLSKAQTALIDVMSKIEL